MDENISVVLSMVLEGMTVDEKQVEYEAGGCINEGSVTVILSLVLCVDERGWKTDRTGDRWMNR